VDRGLLNPTLATAADLLVWATRAGPRALRALRALRAVGPRALRAVALRAVAPQAVEARARVGGLEPLTCRALHVRPTSRRWRLG
jgi:hypothetical protein